MRRLALLPLFLALLVPAAPAAAAERLIAPGYIESVEAFGPYVTWDDNSSGQLLRHAGRTSPFPWPLPYGGVSLGSDAARRVVGVYTTCGGQFDTECVLRERPLSGARERVVYRQRKGESPPSGDVYRGTLAVAVQRPGKPSVIHLRRSGSSRLRPLVTKAGFPSGVDVGPGALVFTAQGNAENHVRVVNLATGADRVFAVDSTDDDDCKCRPSLTQLGRAVVSGRYAYWQVNLFEGGYQETRIARARTDTASNPFVEYYTTDGPASSFAIRGARIVYATSTGLVEATEPAWRRGTRIPAET
jgi:hypothetical protein